MKKIIILFVSLLFSSVHAQMYSEAEIAQVAAQLMQNSELIEQFCLLTAQGLTLQEAVELMTQREEQQAHISELEAKIILAGFGTMFLISFLAVLVHDIPLVIEDFRKAAFSQESLFYYTSLCLTSE
ncbi:hypothetical protein IPF37_02815 [bacterium]|nr:MAG: hypothetical protein IPF37_02815 [bacterium]